MSQISEWREKTLEIFQSLQEKARTHWEAFNQREKIIVLSAGGIFGLALLVFLIQSAGEFLSRAAYDPKELTQELREIENLLADAKRYRADALQYDRLISRQGSDLEITSFIQNQAKQFGLNISSVKPSTSKSSLLNPKDQFFELELQKGVPVDSAMKFLNSIEEGLGVRLIHLELKSNFQDKTKVDLKAFIAYAQQS